MTDLLSPGIDFHPDEAIEIKFQTHAGEMVILKCTIMWTTKIPPQNVRHRLGLEIVELPWDKFNLL